jgi:pimeloyl-ACP methyl ester carboxylesterase
VNSAVRRLLFLISFLLSFSPAVAADQTGPIAPPPSEIVVPDEVRNQIESGLQQLAGDVEKAEQATAGKPDLHDLMPDVIIFQKAVDWALRYHEFYSTNEFRIAGQLIDEGIERAKQLQAGIAPWTEATGLVVRGYRSRVDDSIQPYGVVVPKGWRKGTARKFRLDVWLHGRDDRLTELKFSNQRQRSYGEFAPVDAFVLHPYGRNCNAFKFAGETDVFEGMEAMRKHYPIDDARIAIRGFSMGGGGTWHLAAHYPGIWVAAAPGAGFSESADYLGKLTKEPFPPSWEQTLWGLYDATDYAANFFNLPVVAYNGNLDKQKQAADMMEAAMLREGMHLTRVIGDNVAHQYTPLAREQIAGKIDAIVRAGKEMVPPEVRFATRTLRYARSHWVVAEGLEHQWQPTRVDAVIVSPNEIDLTTTNVSAIRMQFGPGRSPVPPGESAEVHLDGQLFGIAGPDSDCSLNVIFHRDRGRWLAGDLGADQVRKRPGLTGPIDDVFFDSFLMVPPTGQGFHDQTDQWVERELNGMRTNWRGLFRGDAPEKMAADITDADIAMHSLILWGDPQSNPIIRRIADRLPLKWDAQTVSFGDQSFSAAGHVPVLIFPNPLNPTKYVVLNSGFTFRAMGSNADQTPKLPDYAIIDVTKPATGIAPGGVEVAGFFDEAWKLK